MILKYKVPKPYGNVFEDKKVIYCKVQKSIVADNKKVYLVRMINFRNMSNVFAENELQRLNIIDRIKLIKIRRKNK